MILSNERKSLQPGSTSGGETESRSVEATVWVKVACVVKHFDF